MMEKYPLSKLDEYKKILVQWKNDVNEAAKHGKQAPPKPVMPLSFYNPNGASLLYNSMIAPVIPYAIKGVIWYQGEANVRKSNIYRKVFAALIADWRALWRQGDFPFLFVQLANYKTSANQCDPLQWAQLREAQLKTLSVTNTGMAVTIDIGDPNNIHPRNKQDVGRRLALLAIAKAYGYKGPQYSGPIYKSMKVDGNKIILEFDAFSKTNSDELRGFTIAGPDRKFVPAQAEVFKDSVPIPGREHAQGEKQMIVVWSPDVNAPAAVRYGWSDVTSECNLYNAAGLPASPFRTDDWPGIDDKLKY
jgi:sialate O-acetylesterase